jgi:glutathione S-transferase
MPLTLVIANRNYSSWSLRPWIFLTHLGLPFDEVLLPLDTPEFTARVHEYSPTGRVPALVDGDLVIHESIAILEYASELAGGAGWPGDRATRAVARAVAAEMHAGFSALRNACPMNLRASNRKIILTPAVTDCVTRLDALFTAHRSKHHSRGPWLFGEYSAADAMYLPVALRFKTYNLQGLGQIASAYLSTLTEDPLLAPWMQAALAETQVVAHDEVGE